MCVYAEPRASTSDRLPLQHRHDGVLCCSKEARFAGSVCVDACSPVAQEKEEEEEEEEKTRKGQFSSLFSSHSIRSVRHARRHVLYVCVYVQQDT